MSAAGAVPAPEDAATTIVAAQEALAKAAQVAGVTGDPMEAVLVGQAAFLKAGHGIVQDFRQAAREATAQSSADVIARSVGPQIAKALDEAAKRTNRIQNEEAIRQNRRWFVKAAVIATGSALLFGAVMGVGGYWTGRNAGRSEAAAAATDLRAAFADGAPGAAEWRALVTLNSGSIREALRVCEPLQTTSGQPACKVALWTGPLPAPGTKR